MRRRLVLLADRALLATWRACAEFVEDRGHRDAAQMGFFALLSFVPLALLLVAAFGLAFDPKEVRELLIETVFDSIPLAGQDDRAKLEGAVDDALQNAGALGPFSILLLVVAATGVMGALRHAINEAWDIHVRPPIWRRKLLDAAFVVAATLVMAFAGSLAATRRAEDDAEDEGGGGARVLSTVLDVLGDVLPFVFVAGVVLALYRFLPMQRPTVREVWPGALVAAAGLFVVKSALELYFDELADFGALYGSLGAVMALLLFVFAAANVLVFGAEFASEWSRLPDDDEDVRDEVRKGRRRLRQALSRSHRTG